MNVDFADEEMIAYRESLIEKKKEQPFWKKKCLSVNETAAAFPWRTTPGIFARASCARLHGLPQ